MKNNNSTIIGILVVVALLAAVGITYAILRKPNTTTIYMPPNNAGGGNGNGNGNGAGGNGNGGAAVITNPNELSLIESTGPGRITNKNKNPLAKILK